MYLSANGTITLVKDLDEGWGNSSIIDMLQFLSHVMRHMINYHGSGHLYYFISKREALHIELVNGEVKKIFNEQF